MDALTFCGITQLAFIFSFTQFGYVALNLTWSLKISATNGAMGSPSSILDE
jgi:hypothetical protein